MGGRDATSVLLTVFTVCLYAAGNLEAGGDGILPVIAATFAPAAVRVKGTSGGQHANVVRSRM